MKKIFHDYALVWRWTVSHRKPTHLGATIFSGLLFLLFGLTIWGSEAGLVTRAGLFLLYLITLACHYTWCRLIRGAMFFNNPVSAVLVPKFRTLSIQATYLTWLGTSAMTALFVTLVVLANLKPDSPDSIFSLLLTHTIPAFVLTGSFCIFSGMVSTENKRMEIFMGSIVICLFFLILFLDLAATIFKYFVPPGFMIVKTTLKWTDLINTPLFWLIAMGLLLTFVRIFLRVCFLKGGDKHCEEHSTYIEQVSKPVFTLESTQSASKRYGKGTMNDILPFGYGVAPMYANCLRQDCAPGRHWSNMIVHVLGPKSHWSRLPAGIVHWLPHTMIGKGIWVAIIAAIMLFMHQPRALDPKDLIDVFLFNPANSWIMLLMLWFIHFAQLLNHSKRLEMTLPEQKIFFLTAAYQRNHFNRALGLQLLRSNFVQWLFWAGLIMLISVVIGTPLDKLVLQFCLASITLPLICVALEDYSSRFGSDGILITLILVAIACSVMTLVYMYARLPAFQLPASDGTHGWLFGFSCEKLFWQLCIVSSNVLMTLGIIAIRLRALDKMPMAFPAYRSFNHGRLPSSGS